LLQSSLHIIENSQHAPVFCIEVGRIKVQVCDNPDTMFEVVEDYYCLCKAEDG
jgi:hypothetical protein